MKMHSRGRRIQPQEILPLTHENDEANAGSKADNDGVRYVPDHRSEACRAHPHQDNSRHQGCELQACNTVLRSDDRQHRDLGLKYIPVTSEGAAALRTRRTVPEPPHTPAAIRLWPPRALGFHPRVTPRISHRHLLESAKHSNFDVIAAAQRTSFRVVSLEVQAVCPIA